MSDKYFTMVKDGQQVVATLNQTGTIVPEEGKDPTKYCTALVQTEDGLQQVVKTYDMNGGGGGGGYVLPPATAETLGGVKVGETLTVGEDGTLNTAGGDVPDNVWTQDNLVAGDNVSFTKQENPYVIDSNTLAVFHFDNNFNNVIENSNFSITDLAIAAGQESNFTTGSDKKFGTSASDRCSAGGTWYYRNLSIDTAKQFPNGFTIDFWAKRPVSSDIMSSGIIPGGYGLFVNGFGYVGFGAGSYSEPLYTTSWNVNADPTNWHHIAISISPTKRRFFLDGVLVASVDFSGSLELAANATSQFGQVIIDELRITDKALWQDTDDFSADLPTAAYAQSTGDVYQINANCADTSLSNLTDAGQIKAVHLAMPSSTYDELTIPTVDGTNITVSADGYLVLAGLVYGTNSVLSLTNTTTGLQNVSNPSFTSALFYGITIPVSKGDTVRVGFYNVLFNDGANPGYLRFVYANGTTSEQGA